jgi:hypothetical protein
MPIAGERVERIEITGGSAGGSTPGGGYHGSFSQILTISKPEGNAQKETRHLPGDAVHSSVSRRDKTRLILGVGSRR